MLRAAILSLYASTATAYKLPATEVLSRRAAVASQMLHHAANANSTKAGHAHNAAQIGPPCKPMDDGNTARSCAAYF